MPGSFDQELYDILAEKYSEYIKLSENIYHLDVETVKELATNVINYITENKIHKHIFIKMIRDAASYNIKKINSYNELISLISPGEKIEVNLSIYEPGSILSIVLEDNPKKIHKLISKNQINGDSVIEGKTLLEWCCHHGASNCFRLITSLGTKITPKCVEESFISQDNNIIYDCLHNIEPTDACLENAIFVHNDDLTINLLDRHNKKLTLESVVNSLNLKFFFHYLCQIPRDENPLAHILKFGLPTLFTDLVAAGFDIMATQANKDTSFVSASLLDDADHFAKLIANGANINAVDDYGVTPLIAAIQNGNNTFAKKLIEAGADTSLADHDGKTAIDYAKKHENNEIIQLLTK